jgi:hypothetical protein
MALMKRADVGCVSKYSGTRASLRLGLDEDVTQISGNRKGNMEERNETRKEMSQQGRPPCWKKWKTCEENRITE